MEQKTLEAGKNMTRVSVSAAVSLKQRFAIDFLFLTV